ncbi:MAG: dihydrodipicolinate synthase family protein [Anaerolineae bacterium]|nr:dihydrodipicolinate synthase family protein [Anaerolineae bacterium]
MVQIVGIIPPLVTPFTAAEEIDEAALRADVRTMVEQAGVHGLVVGGSTGEGHTLTTDELRLVVGAAVDEAAGRVPVLAGLIVDSTRQAVERVRALSDLDVAALQVTPVHYLFRPSDDMMVRHFAAIAEAGRAPVMLYNVVPWSYCSPALLVRIMREVDGVIGVKQSADDLKLMADLLLMLDGRGLVMSAVDALLYPSFILGAHGAIAAILTAAPKPCVQLWDAVQRGDRATALDLHKRLLRLWNALAGDNLPANVKYAMELQGRRGGFPRAPMPPSSEAQRAAIQAALDLIEYS